MATYKTVITDEGARLIAEAVISGEPLIIAQAGVGDANGEYYVPTQSQTELRHECWRGDVAAAYTNGEYPNVIDVQVAIPADAESFTAREIALYDEDGVMIAVGNLPPTERVTADSGVTGRLTLWMHIAVQDAGAVEFNIVPSTQVLSGFSMTINAADWTELSDPENGYGWEYVLSYSPIGADMVPEVVISEDSLQTAFDAGVCQVAETLDGGLRMLSRYQPAATINARCYLIGKGFDGEEIAIPDWDDVQHKPTTLAGYGITDAATLDEVTALRAAVGSPLKATTAAAMTDTDKIYVYTGSESGYTAGNWYYHNGTAWVSGGVYNSVAVATDTELVVSGMAADAKAVGDTLKKTLQSAQLYIQHSNLGGYTDANDFPANRIIELSSNVTSTDIANLPAYGELAYVITVTYNVTTSYSAQIYFGTSTFATRIKASNGWRAWSVKANLADVVTLDTGIDGAHATYSDKLANVASVCVFVASLANWSDLPPEVKSNSTIINMHQSSGYDLQICFGRGEDKYFGWRVIRRSDRAVYTDWKSPTADLLINGNLLYNNGTNLNVGGGPGTCEVIAITDCPNANIVQGVKATLDEGAGGYMGTRTSNAFRCAAGATYEFSVWARGTGTVRLLVSNLYLRDCECAGDGSWQRFTLRFTANEDANYHFYVYNITPGTYIDIAGRELFVYTPEPEVEALRHTKYWTPNWYQGSLSPSSGGRISAANRVRSEGFVNFADSIDGQLTIVIPEGWGLVGRRYGAPYRSAYERAITVNGTWITDTFTLTTKPDKYYRFVIRKQDDSDITPDDGQESGVSFSYATLEDRPKIKILGIGNSHTRDALRYLRRILDEAGYDAKVGHYYWGGSTLKQQYDALTGATDFPSNTEEHPRLYYYRTYDATGTHTYYSGTLVTALADETWDVVVFQQQTVASAQYDSFFSGAFSINDFIDEVKSRIDNDNLRIGLTAVHTRASDYAGDTIDGVLYTPEMLHEAIQETIPRAAAGMKQCDFIVNSGLAIKYARGNEYLDALGHDMTRIDVTNGVNDFDKVHLEYGVPTFVASMTYALTICGDAAGDIAWYPAPPTFSEAEIYGEGDVVLYDGEIYKKNISTGAEIWNAAHWDVYAQAQLAYLGIQCARKAVRDSGISDTGALNVLSVGDSICYGSRNGRKGYLGDLPVIRRDASFTGACLATTRTARGSEYCIYQQFIDFSEADENVGYAPDVIVADGGVNDYYFDSPLGTAPTKPTITAEDAAALDKSTLLGGLEYLFYLMITKYPSAQRFFVATHRTLEWPWSAHFSGGYTQTQMNEAIAEVCKLYGVELIDVFNRSMINTAYEQYISPTAYNDDHTVTDQHYVDSDGIHPLALGYREGYVPLVREALRIGTRK